MLSANSGTGTYSSRYCFGFSPNSLLTDCEQITLGSFNSAKIRIISTQKNKSKRVFMPNLPKMVSAESNAYKKING
jgi:hypothetical protein